jgi:hypothetical protein
MDLISIEGADLQVYSGPSVLMRIFWYAVEDDLLVYAKAINIVF